MKKLQLLFCLILLSAIGFGQYAKTVPAMKATPGQSVDSPRKIHGPLDVPSLTGPTTVCLNSTNNVYTTNAGQTGYVWTVVGGSITAGGSSSDNTATVKWTTAGNESISVSYQGSSTTTLPVVVNPITASISISASANPVWAGTSVTFTATAGNGGLTPVYQWKKNGTNVGTNSPMYTCTPVNGDVVYCILTSSATCVIGLYTSNAITMVVNTRPLSVTLPSKTATPGQIVYFPVKLIGASISGTPISSANIQITYDPAVVSYDTLINFYSGTPSTQWYFSGNNSTVSANWIEPSLLTLAIPDSTVLFEIKFHYIGGLSALPFTVNEFTDGLFNIVSTVHVDGVISLPAPSLTGPTNICQSAGNVYTTDAGKSNYSWSIAGGTITAGGTSTSNTATVTWTTVGSESISVSYSGTLPTVLPVTVTASPAASVAIVASSNPSCANSSVTFTATPTNGGTTPTYQWKKNGTNVGTNSANYSVVPVNGDVINCVMTSSAACITNNPATSSAITMTVNPLTASISISASANPVYAGTAVTFTATTGNGGPSPTYQWKKNGANVGTNSSTYTCTPVNGDVVYCILSSNAPCVIGLYTSNTITMIVNTRPITVTLPTIYANPGDIVYFPVKIGGASSSGTPIGSANLQITYDPAVLTYDTLVNFYSGTPTTQWYFSGNNNTVSANWIEPSLQTVSIPDSTVLFQIKFHYIDGSSTLPFAVSEFTDLNYNLVTTNKVNGAIGSLLVKSLNLSSLYLEGLYAGSGTMNPAYDENGLHWPDGVADHITIELHNSADYSIVEYSTDVALSTSGNASVNVPSSHNGTYWVTLKHRNTIETASAVPVSFSSHDISYSFNAKTKAYGENMGEMIDGVAVFYSGDENQDGIVDGSDLSDIGNDASFAMTGYIPTDLTGDGLVDGSDLSICGNNASFAVIINLP